MSILSVIRMEVSKCEETLIHGLIWTWQHVEFQNSAAPVVPIPPISPEHSSCSEKWSGKPAKDENQIRLIMLDIEYCFVL